MAMSSTISKVIVGNQASRVIQVRSGMRQGDALSAVLSNLALHSAIQKVEPSGTIVSRTTQLFGYANDIALIGRNSTALKELFNELAKEAKILALKINENKTKYLIISNLQARREPRNLSIGEYDFEGVREFFLGTNINSENKVNKDIQKRIMAGNQAYFACIKLFRSKLMSKDINMNLLRLS
jgi:hypothetical protein